MILVVKIIQDCYDVAVGHNVHLKWVLGCLKTIFVISDKTECLKVKKVIFWQKKLNEKPPHLMLKSYSLQCIMMLLSNMLLCPDITFFVAGFYVVPKL